jgi:hypothetical protein
MTDNIRDAVIDLYNGNVNSFKEKIETSLMDRAIANIDVKRIEVGQSLFNSADENGEVE